MKNKKVAMLSLMVVGVFVLSSFGIASQNAANAQIVTNFELIVETNTGNRRRESFALYLRQALAPLGIDVQVLGKPFNQFVGDLLHFTDQDWDISIVGFSGGSPFAPGYVDLYACRGGFFGVLTYQLCEDTWNDALVASSTAQGEPLNQTYIDDLVWDMELELDIVKRKEMTFEFQRIFMERLLLDYPLLAPTGLAGIWAGFEGYDANEGVIGSAFTGGDWDYANYPTLEERENDEDTIAFSIGSIDHNFNPLEGASVPQSNAEANLFPTLSMFDKGYLQHPNVASGFVREDWTDAPTLDPACVATAETIRDCAPVTGGESNNTVELGKITYTVNQDLQMNWTDTSGVSYDATTDTYTGDVVKTAPILASDFEFTFKLYMSDYVTINGQSSFANVWDVTSDDETGEVTIYVYQPTLEDVFFGSYQAIPHALLGGTLDYDGTPTYATHLMPPADTTGLTDPRDLPQDAVFETTEFDAFSYNPWQGGQYFVNFDDDAMFTDGEFLIKKANPHYWFPTESLDSPGGVFDPIGTPGYYFNYNGGDRVTEFTIDTIKMPIIEDLTVDLILFKSGRIDLNSPDFFGGSEIEAQRNDPRFEVQSFATTSTADLLMFNMIDDDLKNYDVRRAIAHAVDKQALQAIVDNLREPQDSPVKILFKNSGWYTDEYKIEHDLDEAKRLMVLNGYTIPGFTVSEVSGGDGNTNTGGAGGGGVFSDIQQAGSEFFILLSAFATVVTAVSVKRRRN